VFRDLHFVDLVVVDLVLCSLDLLYCLCFCLPAFDFYFLSTSDEIGREEHLQYEQFIVECDFER